VFVIAIFDPVLANRSPSPILPVSESLPGHLAKGKQKRQSPTSKTSESIGASSSDNQLTDEQSYAESSFAQFKEGDVAALKASGGVLGGGSETLIVGALTVSDLTKQVTNEIVSKNLLQVVEPFVKSSQAQNSEMGTGGGNTPMLAFDTQFGSNANVTEDIAPTLKSSQQSPSVAYSIREDAKANNFSATELDHANSLSALRPSPQSHHAQMFIAESTMAVRRLTPLECERLMGWPDNHTLTKADGTTQADTHRYKQCGNGVASPVAQWIAKHLLNI
jgi:site-specific DNA-cytosine methylase